MSEIMSSYVVEVTWIGYTTHRAETNLYHMWLQSCPSDAGYGRGMDVLRCLER